MSIMIDEIKEESEAITKTIETVKDSMENAYNTILRSDYVIITGSGTSFNAGISLQISLMRKQIPAVAVRAPDFEYYIPEKLNKKIAIIVLSQSGESIDALTAMKLAHLSGGRVIGITNESQSNLAMNSDVAILTSAGPEHAVAATKSYISELTAIALLQGKLSNVNVVNHLNSISIWVKKTVDAHLEFQKVVSKLHNKIVFLGDGYLYGTASEAALKFRETGNLMTEYHNIREYLHGPIQTLDDDTTVMILNDGKNKQGEVLKEIRRYTDSVISVGSGQNDSINVFNTIEELMPIVQIVPLQILAYYKALSLGLNPDKPTKLNKVVR